MGTTIDAILVQIGQFGKYQIQHLAVLYILVLPPAFHLIVTLWVAYEPSWQCVVNSTACLLNGTFNVGQPEYSFRCALNRSDWEYTRGGEGPETSIVSQFDLVCENSVYAWLGTSVLFISMSVSAVPVGMISDKYGRLVTLYPSAALVAISGVASAFATEYWHFIAARVLTGLCMEGLFIPVLVLTSELVGPSYRAMSETMAWNFWALGFVTIGAIAYFVRDWRTLMVISSAPWILILALYKFIPESIRWQATHNKMENAEKTLRAIARVNKKPFPEESISAMENESQSAGCLKLFSTSWLTFAVVVQSFTWFANSSVYYGASYSAGDFGGNMYFNFLLTSLVEIPANFIAIYSCNRYGRKKSVILPMILGGISCIVVSLIPAGTTRTDFITGRVFCGIFGKGAISVSFGAVLVWASELFPTTIRSKALSTFQAFANVGGICAPFIVEADRVHAVLPFAIMGGLAIIASLLCLLLPETRNKPTLEVLEDTEVVRMLNTEKPDEEKITNDGEYVADKEDVIAKSALL